ncbi:MAG TPA: hypothetical protein VLL69_12450, partial [Streptosporangiaceae bacterium]|nr:hypothetical protein [Streptosporangiaceae bacterium]
MLGEEDDLAGAAGQLTRVVRGQFGLRLADAPHHGEHVLAGLRGRRLLQLRPGHPADQVVVDALRADVRGSVRERGLVPRHHPASEGPFCRPDRPASSFVQLNREVGDTAGGDVGGHVELAPAHDAEVDHALARRGMEASVGGRQAGVLERVCQLFEGLAIVDPAEELPDRPEVVDVVDQRGAGQRHQQGPVRTGPDAAGEREDVLGTLRGLVLD